MTLRKIIFICLLLAGSLQATAKPKDPLLQCWNKQVKPLKKKKQVLKFNEKFKKQENHF